MCSFGTITIDAYNEEVEGSEKEKVIINNRYSVMLTHYSGRVTQICVFNTVKLGTSAISP